MAVGDLAGVQDVSSRVWGRSGWGGEFACVVRGPCGSWQAGPMLEES